MSDQSKLEPDISERLRTLRADVSAFADTMVANLIPEVDSGDLGSIKPWTPTVDKVCRAVLKAVCPDEACEADTSFGAGDVSTIVTDTSVLFAVKRIRTLECLIRAAYLELTLGRGAEQRDANGFQNAMEKEVEKAWEDGVKCLRDLAPFAVKVPEFHAAVKEASLIVAMRYRFPKPNGAFGGNIRSDGKSVDTDPSNSDQRKTLEAHAKVLHLLLCQLIESPLQAAIQQILDCRRDEVSNQPIVADAETTTDPHSERRSVGLVELLKGLLQINDQLFKLKCEPDLFEKVFSIKRIQKDMSDLKSFLAGGEFLSLCQMQHANADAADISAPPQQNSVTSATDFYDGEEDGQDIAESSISLLMEMLACSPQEATRLLADHGGDALAVISSLFN